jgi:uncharacterized Ntn-hydrolase superfamily protein
MTFSITARCHKTGELGVGITTAWFAVGASCPAARAGVGAIASQAMANSSLRGICLDRLEQGEAPEAALAAALSADAGVATRQVALIDAQGRTAVHTGDQCVGACGSRIVADAVIAGNMLASDAVLDATAAAWLQTRDTDTRFAERLLIALEAGQDAGGDVRGKQSAALAAAGEAPAPDLRVDDASDPLVELRRLLGVYRERYEPLYLMMRAAAKG